MPVDNALYDRLADTWWNESGFLNLLRTLANPVRFAYIRDALAAHYGATPHLRLLDIGSGGGLLAEEFARAGYDVCGVDPSANSVAVARRHAIDSGLPAQYAVAAGESLPFRDETFDAAYCCDVLEHVDDYDLVIDEAARVLKPNGYFFFDTFNRTVRSKIVMIKLLQEWRWSRVMMPATHDWDLFITPRELTTNMAWHGLVECDITGLRPHGRAIAVPWHLWQRRRGRISYAELGRRLRLERGRGTNVMYMGYAVKKIIPAI
jgi:2-polyprenyl-6-hydroxyphenyl methylase/3-demethylubiquinone-9 3-methyltransferase